MIEFKKGIHYSPELEKAVLGVCLIESEAFARTFQYIKTEHFYTSNHQTVFTAMSTLFNSGRPIDILTVSYELMRMQNITELDGYNTDHFITRLTNNVVSSTNVEYHCFIIKSMWMEREVTKLTSSGIPINGDIKQKISELNYRLMDIGGTIYKKDWQDMTELMVGIYQHQDKMKRTGGLGIRSGIDYIDRINGGFHPGQMIFLGARPSVGKSAFVGNIAVEMAKQGTVVGIISLEMNNVEIAARIASYDTDTNFNALFRGLYRDEQQAERVYDRIGRHTSRLPIFISDKTNVSVFDIKSKAASLKAKENLGCLIIDYIQLIDAVTSRNKNREQEVAEISRACKIMAKEMNIPVIILGQLHRDITKRKGEDRYPHLSDIRESGSLEQDSDIVMFLHRDWMAGFTSDADGNSTEFDADLVVRKWRNGNANFIIPFHFDGPKMKFTEKEKDAFKPITVEYQAANPYTKDNDPF